MVYKCPACGNDCTPDSRFCQACGCNVESAFSEVPFCPACKSTYPPDHRFCTKDGSRLIRPADIIFQGYPKAPLMHRFCAALLDGIIAIVLSIPSIVLVLAGLERRSYDYGGSGFIVIAILFYSIPLTYGLIKDGLGRGQSWGKRALDLMVVNLDNNAPCSKGKSSLRNFISALVSIIPFVGWLVEPILVLATSNGRKLGDRAANTQVIDKEIYY